jgi:hypothetical protein
MATGRRLWNWHFWLGLTALAPLLWWMGSALVFALWPIQTVRGKAGSTGKAAPVLLLRGALAPPPEVLEGASSLTIRGVEGHAVALVERGEATEVWDLEPARSLGPVIPADWAREAARRDFAGPYEEAAVYLFPRKGPGLRISGTGPEQPAQPGEYGGPRPAYAFHLHAGSTHLYVDALTAEVRARRSSVWRFYDLAFRLHSFDFAPDGLKRSVTGAVIGLWFALGGTGLALALRRRKRG